MVVNHETNGRILFDLETGMIRFPNRPGTSDWYYLSRQSFLWTNLLSDEFWEWVPDQ